MNNSNNEKNIILTQKRYTGQKNTIFTPLNI